MENNVSNDIKLNLDALLSKMESFVTTKSVIGEPIIIDGVTILPLIDLSFGFGVGSAAKNVKTKDNSESAGGGLGANLKPSAVLIIQNGTVQLINLKNQDSISKIIDMAPGIMNKLGITDFIDGFKKSKDGVKKETAMDINIPEEKYYEESGYTTIETVHKNKEDVLSEEEILDIEIEEE